MQYRRLAALILVAALAACGSDGDTGPEDLSYTLGIISGNGQVAQAGDAELPEPVETRLVSVKLADGTTRFQLVRPLYAQTPVNGSPVPGAVVCSEPPEGVSEDGVWLRPKARCTNTDSNGEAVFTYLPPTVAGEARAYVRGTVDGVVVDLDSVTAVVKPGPAVEGGLVTNCQGHLSGTSDTLDVGAFYMDTGQAVWDAYGNARPWHLESFPTSTLYTLREDGQAIIAAPDASGIDSVRVMSDTSFVRVSHVYVRHPDLSSTVVLFSWNSNGDCGDVNIPSPYTS